MTELLERWRRSAALIEGARDVLDARPWSGEPPRALVMRGWTDCLLGLDDGALDRIEIHGVDGAWPAAVPPSLVAFSDAIRAATELDAIGPTRPASDRALRRREKPRKQLQVDAFASVVGPLAGAASRVVDVGSGHGHLTRELAARLGRNVEGLERDAALVMRARALSTEDEASFVATDVLADGLGVGAGDCAIGLHACGELGDAMVGRAADVGASVALVSCCLQKGRGAWRRPLARSAAAGVEGALDAVTLPRRLLGLSNLTPRDRGVEASRVENLAARARRMALHRLLAARLPGIATGAELEGLNRRAAHDPLDVLVARAFAARGLEPPSAGEVADAEDAARTQALRARRLSVPRNLMARALETFVLFDRALHLEERGMRVRIGALFPIDVSARNLLLVADRGAGARGK